MAHKILLTALFIVFYVHIYAQPPIIKWQQSFGGSALDHVKDIKQTTDSGFIICGYTRSTDGDVTNNHGDESQQDAWLLKLDKDGKLLWQKCFGGTKDDEFTCILQTKEGHFALAGFTHSDDGDLLRNNGQGDAWFALIDSVGNLLHQQTFGGSGTERFYSIVPTNDSGFVMAGFTDSKDGDITTNHGGQDYWVVKINKTQDIIWQQTFGNGGNNSANSVCKTFDGGFIIAGVSECVPGDTTMSHQHAGTDYWVIKTDDQGSLQWQKAFGGSKNEVAKCIIQSADSNYVITGQTSSSDGDISSYRSTNSTDVWAVCIDRNGNIKWEKTLGGSGIEGSRTIVPCRDGGLLIGGSTSSNDGHLDNNNRIAADMWLIKLKNDGTLAWNRALGGKGEDNSSAAIETYDGGYVIAGDAGSSDKDITHAKGRDDAWVAKLEDGKAPYANVCSKVRIFPNPCDGDLHIGLDKDQEEVQLTLHSAIGNLVFSNQETNTYRIFETDHLQPGLYFVTLTDKNNERCTTSIILQ